MPLIHHCRGIGGDCDDLVARRETGIASRTDKDAVAAAFQRGYDAGYEAAVDNEIWHLRQHRWIGWFLLMAIISMFWGAFGFVFGTLWQ